MNKFLPSLTALLALAGGSAFAADLPVAPVYRGPPPAYVPSPAYNFSGCYIGGNAGGMWEHDTTTITLNDPTDIATPAFLAGAIPNGFNYDRSSWLAGGQIGCNYQVTNWLLGLETDFDGTNLIGGQTINTAVPGFLASTSTVTQNMDWIGTARGRFGMVWNNVLLYSTGGLAYGHVRNSYSFNNVVGGGTVSIASSDEPTQFGWTVGGGLEVGFGNWSVKGEALYYDLGSHTLSAPCTVVGGAACAGPNTTFFSTSENKGVIARAGVNYRFDWFSPVAARY